MTMFSMKPKFDLAEFLAKPAPRGGKNGKSFGRSAKSAPKPAAAAKKAEPESDD